MHCLLVLHSVLKTSVSETIRKSPLVEAQNAVEKQKNMAKTIFNMAAVRHLEF